MEDVFVRRAETIVGALRRNPRTVPDNDVLFVLEFLPAHYVRTRSSVYVAGVRGAPDWLEHESLMWDLSELVRSWLRAKHVRGERNAVLDTVAQLVLDTGYAKGRQNFVLILGDFGDASYSNVLAQLVADPSLSGHAVKALTKLRLPGHAVPIRKLLSETKVGWIKTAARKYLRLVEDEREKS